MTPSAYSALMPQGFQPAPESPKTEELSLHKLSQAFAKAMGIEVPPGAAPAAVSGSPASAEADGTERMDENSPAIVGQATDDHCPLCPTSILEAMLFVGNRGNQPLTAQQAAELMRGVQPNEIPGLVDGLNHRYETAGCPYQIVSDRSGYRMTLRTAFSALRDRFYGRIRDARLSQAAVDVLAIVSYRQPITAREIAQLRGRPSGRLLSQLVRRRLLQIQRPEGRRGLAQYHTAERFLELFGLQGLEDLPQSEDLD